MWQFTGQRRPDFAEEPGPGQESVWDYPRPPVLVNCDSRVIVSVNGQTLASTTAALRLLETASPPTFYIPADDVDWTQLVAAPGSSFCEWKGSASYWGLAEDVGADPVAWSYPQPNDAYSAITNAVGFYPGRVACTVDGERVRPQPGYFYGGWITEQVVGPFKGEPGTGHW